MTRNDVMMYLAEVRDAKVNRKGHVKGVGRDYLVQVLVAFDEVLAEKQNLAGLLGRMTDSRENFQIRLGFCEKDIAAYEAIGKAMSTPKNPVDTPAKMGSALKGLMKYADKLRTSPGRTTRDEKADMKTLRKVNHELTTRLGHKVKDSPEFKELKEIHQAEIVDMAEKYRERIASITHDSEHFESMVRERDIQIQNIAPDMQALKDRLVKTKHRLSVHLDAMQTIHELASRLRNWGDDTRPPMKEEIVAACENKS